MLEINIRFDIIGSQEVITEDTRRREVLSGYLFKGRSDFWFLWQDMETDFQKPWGDLEN